MTNLNVQTFDQLVASQVAAMQGTASPLLDVSTGSVLRATAEGNAGVLLWPQSLIIQVLTTTRAATSLGSDLDSWMADYGLSRLPAVAGSPGAGSLHDSHLWRYRWFEGRGRDGPWRTVASL